jgi:UDP:flavonoid glycosyltransferase YjiC (YdhE family)
MADEALAPLLESVGGAPDSDEWHFGDLYLHPMPASLDRDGVPASVRRIRPWTSSTGSAASAASDAPAIDHLGRDRPAVYATFGTEFGPMAPWSALLEALGGLDVDALVTTGASGLPADLVAPANVTVAEYVDQHVVFERAAVVVSHGGSGTLLGAAAAGRAQVCIPLGADQFENAVAAAARGIGVLVEPTRRDAATIAESVQRALTDPTIAHAALEVAAELAEGADLEQAADWIERLGEVAGSPAS